jgi:hypothetical protein
MLYLDMKRNGKVDESTKNSLDRLCQHFDQFIAFTHGEGSSESAQIVKEWGNFKVAIEKDPADLEGLTNYVDKLPSQKQQQITAVTPTLAKCMSSPTILPRTKSGGVEIKSSPDWARLKRGTRELMQAVRRNNLAMGL